ncbi:hypothetical protein ES705_10977 [subsurface metagenome]
MNKKYPFLIYLLLAFFYVVIRLPNILSIQSFSNLVFPLNSLYVSQNLLFSGWGMNPELAKTVLSPSNGSLICPPGIYILTRVLGNVRNIFIFHFLYQMLVPLLTFRLFRSVTSTTIAILFSLLSIFYVTQPNWWAPDWIIQPMMLVALILIITRGIKEEMRGSQLIVIGLLTGLITIFKHNIGISFAILCITFIFWSSLNFRNNTTNSYHRFLTFLHLFIFLLFGLIFSARILYFDEFIFYLLPYFVFLGSAFYFLGKNSFVTFNLLSFYKKVSLFCFSALFLPAAIFLWVGSVIGFSRYWYSLFRMGFKYLPIWDYGIVSVTKHYVHFQGIASVKNIYHSLNSLVMMLMFLSPFIVNCFVNLRFFQLIRNKKIIDFKKYFQVSSISMMGIFLFFPLEGYHILATKLFMFYFVFLYFVKKFSLKVNSFLKYILILLFIFVSLPYIKRVITPKIETCFSSHKRVQEIIGLPMEKRLAEEIDKQVAVVERSVKGAPYCVVDSFGATLATLITLVNNHYPQYYLEMRKGILNQEVTNAIISSLKEVPFVLVNYNDYRKYLSKEQEDLFMRQILDFVDKNYVEIDHYEAPKDPSLSHILSFSIMKKR